MSAVPMKFKKVRVVTLPLFKWQANLERYYRFDGAMFQGKPMKENVAEGAKKKEPAILANVTDLETGEQGQIILGKVLQEILTEDYPADAYVGKCFAIEQRKIAGKDYNGYSVTEIEPNEAQGASDGDGPAATETPASAPAKAKGKK